MSDFFAQFGQGVFAVATGALAQFLGTIAWYFVRRRPVPRRPPEALFVVSRGASSNGRPHPTLELNPTPIAITHFAFWLIVAVACILWYRHVVGDANRIVTPVDGQPVGRTFFVKGEAPGAPVGTMVFMIVRDQERPGAAYIVSDIWTIGPNRWWQGVCEVPAGVPRMGKLFLYAVTASDPAYSPGDTLEVPVPCKRRGGQADGVTLRYTGG